MAKRLRVSPQQLTSAMKGAAIDQVDAALAVGKLTQAQANAIKQRIQQQGGAPFGPLFFARPGGPGTGGWGRLFGPSGHGGRGLYGPGGPGGWGGPYGPRVGNGSRAPIPPGFPPGPRFFRGSAGSPLAAVASYLGVTQQQLLQDLSSGKSLAQIVTSRGKTASGLKNAILADLKAKLDKAVAAKMITSAQEQKVLSRHSAGLDARINHPGLRPFPASKAFRPGSRPAAPRLFPSYGGGSGDGAPVPQRSLSPVA